MTEQIQQEPAWQKSSRSDGGGQQCVEVAVVRS